MREWAIVCDAPRHGVCLAGWEPLSNPNDGGERIFEAFWSVEPEVVREAARICAEIAAAVSPELVEPIRARLDAPPRQPAERAARARDRDREPRAVVRVTAATRARAARGG